MIIKLSSPYAILAYGRGAVGPLHWRPVGIVRHSIAYGFPVPLESLYPHWRIGRFVLHGLSDARQGSFSPPLDFNHDVLPIEPLEAFLFDGDFSSQPPVGLAFGLFERLLVRVEPLRPNEPGLFDRPD